MLCIRNTVAVNVATASVSDCSYNNVMLKHFITVITMMLCIAINNPGYLKLSALLLIQVAM